MLVDFNPWYTTVMVRDLMHRWLHSVTPHGELRRMYRGVVFDAEAGDCAICGDSFSLTPRDRYLFE
jgi:hypothetical protein